MAFDLDTVLGVFAATWAVVVLVQAQRTRQRGWFAFAALLLLLLAAGLLLFPLYAGRVVGGVWLPFGLLPLLALRLVSRLIAGERYRPAHRLYRVLALVHPADGWPLQARIVGAIRAAGDREFQPVDRLVDALRPQSLPAARVAVAQLYRLKRDADGLLRWWDEQGLVRDLARNATVATFAIWALAEHGELSRALDLYRRLREEAPALRYRSLRHGCELVLFTRAGWVEQVARLLDGPMAATPALSRAYCLLSARYCAGDQAVAAELDEIRQRSATSNALLHRAVTQRLAHPQPQQPPRLEAEEEALLHELARELDEHQRFAPGSFASRRPVVTIALSLAIGLVFALELALGGPTDPETLWRLGALDPWAVAQGQWWRLLTSTFLHFGWLHLLLNTLALLFFGPYVEWALGRARFIWCYFASGIGSMSTLTLAAQLGWVAPAFAVGASGSILGIVGATGAVLLLGWRTERAALARRRLILIGTIVLLQALFDLVVPQVSGLAHSSGALIGFLSALLLGRASRAKTKG